MYYVIASPRYLHVVHFTRQMYGDGDVPSVSRHRARDWYTITAKHFEVRWLLAPTSSPHAPTIHHRWASRSALKTDLEAIVRLTAPKHVKDKSTSEGTLHLNPTAFPNYPSSTPKSGRYASLSFALLIFSHSQRHHRMRALQVTIPKP